LWSDDRQNGSKADFGVTSGSAIILPEYADFFVDVKITVTFLKRSLNNLRVSIRPEHPNAEDDGSIVPGQIKPDCQPAWFFLSHWQSGRAQNGIMAELVTIRPERGMNDADCHKYTESEGTVKLSDKVRWK
jgi:hypothetical protein